MIWFKKQPKEQLFRFDMHGTKHTYLLYKSSYLQNNCPIVPFLLIQTVDISNAKIITDYNLCRTILFYHDIIIESDVYATCTDGWAR